MTVRVIDSFDKDFVTIDNALFDPDTNALIIEYTLVLNRARENSPDDGMRKGNVGGIEISSSCGGGMGTDVNFSHLECFRKGVILPSQWRNYFDVKFNVDSNVIRIYPR